MASPRWRKVIRDLWLHRVRTFLVIMAIAVGIVGAGSVLNTYALLKRALGDGYLATNPPSATITADSISGGLVARIRQLPAIRDAQAMRVVSGRLAAGQGAADGLHHRAPVGDGGRPTLRLFVMDDFGDRRIALVDPQAGAWPPADGQIVIEQSSLPLLAAQPGDLLTVKTPNGTPHPLTVAGIVRDAGLAPGWMEHTAYGYVTLKTLEQLGESPYLDQLQFVVAEDRFNLTQIRRTAASLRTLIEDDGRRVHDVFVPSPGKHIHAEQMNSLLYVQAAFGFLTLVLSGILVVNFMAAILAGQVREIGVMKAVGGSTAQIAGTYAVMVLLLGLAASILAIPPAIMIGRAYAGYAASLLNFDVTGYAIPWWAIALQLGVGVLLPVAAASVPIARGVRVTVTRAVRDYGIDEGAFGGSWIDRLVSRVTGTSRPLLLSVRNTVRRRGRLALTLLTLAAGGAIFLGALNLRASIRQAMARTYDALGYDVAVEFSRPYPSDQIERIVGLVPGVASVETWGRSRAAIVSADGMLGNAFPVIAPASHSALIEYPIVEGRWLAPGDSNVLVVNSQLIDQEPQVRVGNDVTLALAGVERVWTVVGVVVSSPTVPVAYADDAFLSQYTEQRAAMVVTDAHDADSQSETAALLALALDAHGMDVASSRSVESDRAIGEDHMLMVANFLWVMSFLIVAVGGLGLATTMSLAVLERTREIGVMRSIGAAHRTILGIVLIEGVMIGVLSWMIAVPSSLPVSVFLGKAFGKIMFQAPVVLSATPSAAVVWLAIVILLSGLASLWPALRAVRVTTSEALSWE